MDFSGIVKERYATKSFDGKQVSQSKIDELFEIIRYSASSFGLQPYKIKVITDASTKEKLASASWNQKQITTCSHLLVFCAYGDIKARIEGYGRLMREKGMSQDAINGAINMYNGFEAGLSAEQKMIWAQKQVYLAVANAINGAKSLGLDSCPMEGFDQAQYSRILGLPENLRPTVLVPIGYANDAPRPKIRFSREDLFF